MMLVVSGSMSSQTTAIPDVSFEQALIDCDIDTNGLNGNILNADAEYVETLNIFGNNIFDLTGIEAFQNLKYLYCYNNNIATINLSNNLELEVLDIENNGLLSLDVTLNVALKELYISNNLLNSIDISNNLDLEIVTCSLNSISELDVSNNTVLEVLWCYSNNLNTLSIANNPMLESFFCGDNNLSELDISNNSHLDVVSCGQNNLNELNVTNNSLITYLDISNNNINDLDISSNPHLKRILCSNNNLTELDLTNAPDLLLFYALFNGLEEIDVSQNPNLRFLRLENNNLNHLDLRNNYNSQISDFNSTNNPNLSCIYVDDDTAIHLQNWITDAHSNFVIDESACNALNITESIKPAGFQMYPNPANSIVFVSVPETNALLEVYSLKGQLVQRQVLLFGQNEINLSNYSSGMYVVKIATESTSLSKKLIIE